MKGPVRSAVYKNATYLAVIAMLVVAATPLPATESEIKAEPAEAVKPEVECAQDFSQGTATAESDTEICIDADAGQTAAVNTFEDIYSVSGGSLALLLRLIAEPTVERKPTGAEVLWTEVEKKHEKINVD